MGLVEVAKYKLKEMSGIDKQLFDQRLFHKSVKAYVMIPIGIVGIVVPLLNA